MEGRTKLCFLVILVLVASPATLAGTPPPPFYPFLVCVNDLRSHVWLEKMSIDRMRYHPYSPDIILLSLSSGTRS
jgi:hypothetical protein